MKLKGDFLCSLEVDLFWISASDLEVMMWRRKEEVEERSLEKFILEVLAFDSLNVLF